MVLMNIKEQLLKIDILNVFLEKYDNGHRDVFFCLAVNLMDVNDLNIVLNQASKLTGNDKSDVVKQILIDSASKRGIVLKLRKGDWW